MDANAAASLNLLLRGGAVLLLVLMAAVLWRDHPKRVAARLGAAFAVGAAAATLTDAPGAAAPELWRAGLAALAAGAMFVFWLFSRALFDDAFRLRPWHAAAWLLLAGIGAWRCIAGASDRSPLAGIAGMWLGAMPVVWALLAIAQSLASWRDDLVEGRRRLRSWIVAATSLYTVAQLLAALALGLSLKAVIESPLNAAGTAALTVFVAARLLRSGGDLFASGPLHAAAGARAAVPAAASAAPADEAPDPRHVTALETLMAVDHLYREPGLTIGALAERMALPEHKLRRLINRGLGHRNFSAFLNDYRLADAKRWLADREQAETPILTIAMDAGFQSLGPFNRAFKADTGVTPSEFRRLSGAADGIAPRREVAESGIG